MQQFGGQAFNVVNSAVCESSEVWRRTLLGTLLLDILGGAGDLAGVADRPPLVDEVVTSACDDSARCWFALASCRITYVEPRHENLGQEGDRVC